MKTKLHTKTIQAIMRKNGITHAPKAASSSKYCYKNSGIYTENLGDCVRIDWYEFCTNSKSEHLQNELNKLVEILNTNGYKVTKDRFGYLVGN